MGASAYGVYKFECISSGAYGGGWQLYKDNVEQTIVSYSDMVSDYGVSASYDLPDITPTVDDYIVVTYQHESVAGEGFHLDADGNLECYDAKVNGAVNASTFTFNNVNMRWGWYKFSDGNVHAIDLTTAFGVTQGDLVTISWALYEEEPTAKQTVSFILDDTARSISVDSTLVNTAGTVIKYLRGSGGVSLGISIQSTSVITVAIQAYHNTTA